MAPPKLSFQTEQEYLRYLKRQEDSRNYRARHREKCRAAGRERMQRLRAKATEEQRARHREAQARYREKYREWIAQKARLAARQKNTAAGKQTKSRLRARHYYSSRGHFIVFEPLFHPRPILPLILGLLLRVTFPLLPRTPLAETPALRFARCFGGTGRRGCATQASRASAWDTLRGSRTPRRSRASCGCTPCAGTPRSGRSREGATPGSGRSRERACVQKEAATSPRGEFRGGGPSRHGVAVRTAPPGAAAPRERDGGPIPPGGGRPMGENPLLEMVGVADGASEECDGGRGGEPANLKAALVAYVGVVGNLGAVAQGPAVTNDGLLLKTLHHCDNEVTMVKKKREALTLSVMGRIAEDLRMDDRGIKDPRFYCLPPDRTRGGLAGPRGGKYPLHLVTQGNVVGYFDNWPEAKESLSGYPGNSNHGCYTVEECIEVWQRLCTLGVHPHPVEPREAQRPSASASDPFRPSPKKSGHTSTTSPEPCEESDGTGKRASKSPVKPTCPSTPTASMREPRPASSPNVNFVIGGTGIVSSSADRTEQHYLDMQRRREEPELLITRLFARAKVFAIDDDEVAEEDSGF
ncbi:hypothetical protein B0H12DRAFT_1080429 [Mycena haematopus]|nr:hypothetical protein B0H12DRAFT_1080429 [Mycena haematopus]